MTFSTRIGAFTFTVPAGTPIDSPFETDISFGDNLISKVEVKIPPGHNGVTGLQVVSNGLQVIPWVDQGGWLVADNDLLMYPIETEVNSQLSLSGYNIGTYDHSFYLRFFYTPISLAAASPSAITPLTIVPIA